MMSKTNGLPKLEVQPILEYQTLARERIVSVLDIKQAAARVEPKNPLCQLTLGEVLFEHQDYSGAIDSANKTLALDPKSAQAYSLLGASYARLNNDKEAELALYDALKLDPNHKWALLELGRIFHRDENTQGAIEMYQKVLEMDPNYAQAHYEIAADLNNIQKVDESFYHSRRAVELEPTNLNYTRLAGILFSRRKVDDALAVLEESIKIEPQDAERWFSYANFLVEAGNTKEALEIYEKLIDIYPDQANLFCAIGASYMYLERNSEAIVALEKSVSLFPSPRAHYLLARLSYIRDKAGELERENLRAAFNAMGKKSDEKNYEISLCKNIFEELHRLVVKNQKDTEIQILALKKMCELNPKKTIFFHQLAIFLFRVESYKEALEVLGTTLERCRNDAKEAPHVPKIEALIAKIEGILATQPERDTREAEHLATPGTIRFPTMRPT